MRTINHSKPTLSRRDFEEVHTTLRSGFIASGSKVIKFESEVLRMIGQEKAKAFSSGSSALSGALSALGISCGDEVIIPTYVCENVMNAVLSVGATPVLSDVDYIGCLTPSKVIEKVNKKTRAIIAVHTFGHICDIQALESIGVPVIEDACQAFGFHTEHGVTGALGSISILSFHATKCMTTGEGGMLLWSKNIIDEHQLPGELTTMSDMQASLGLSQIGQYPLFLKQREDIKIEFDNSILKSNSLSSFNKNARHVFRYVARTKLGFEATQKIFAKNKILCKRGVDMLLHRNLDINDKNFPVATSLFNSLISIPIYPALSVSDIRRICNVIESV